MFTVWMMRLVIASFVSFAALFSEFVFYRVIDVVRFETRAEPSAGFVCGLTSSVWPFLVVTAESCLCSLAG